jgi:hypothetical protein
VSRGQVKGRLSGLVLPVEARARRQEHLDDLVVSALDGVHEGRPACPVGRIQVRRPFGQKVPNGLRLARLSPVAETVTDILGTRSRHTGQEKRNEESPSWTLGHQGVCGRSL